MVYKAQDARLDRFVALKFLPSGEASPAFIEKLTLLVYPRNHARPIPRVLCSRNSVASGVLGATIAGGGGNHPSQFGFVPNTVTANWGTVGGGGLNTVGGLFATVAGGHKNTATS